ncbi:MULTISPECIES: AAA family ATPase [unclassified Paenibacillus]|uniref:AAA family ATPase n=1 Tax=unclassified Paenibacillus TaxID=185978 RepID=UPI002405BD83|nr:MULTISPECIES: AAA family ATPase [unclassified Paenibacillus]MDF9840776.1 AAA+ superfamily predicted ATPase [Paenibacillus sp. PastF-2]MDF9847359.1 AAA+ superfamily predicted ATPase [Paenibacillus sp. PastM-2]MDF9854063.1 AAA+ superfamily predicted ATPase [Paenibacillus sp. PastF-1]MDH6479336.1 AAA+ superfamily predicted ATPase [Paenibacillus sp. PastH-2]MDH6506931.1 AAA+ superfamily predicted ATPase [Paenibacillus sp. PastM-3]
MLKNAESLLISYVEALRPIIYIHHFDFKTIDLMLKKISYSAKILEFNPALGAVDFHNKTRLVSSAEQWDLKGFLESVLDEGYDYPLFVVLKDVHPFLEDPAIISLLKMIAERNMYQEDFYATVFIVASKLVIPGEIGDYITIFEVPLPDETEVAHIICNFAEGYQIEVDPDTLGEISISFKGLNEFQITQILNLAYQDGGIIDKGDKELILMEKEQFIKKTGMLEMVPLKESIDDIGGLEILKEWLLKKSKVFKNLDKAIKFGVDIPKGIMIVGMPGCGKSLTAKATAQLFEIPLVRLDVGRLLGKYVGESEENMRRAMKLAEAISPCVLWVDEIEKAFAGVGSNSGNEVTTRLFGQFLTWMQEKENTVFIVATANDISNLPAEFLRKGRFDELFFVDLPKEEERRNIIEIHLKRRKKWNKSIDSILLIKETEGYNGADIESIIKETIEQAFINGYSQITTDHLITTIKDTKSISVTLKEKIAQIRKTVVDMDIKLASRSEIR